MKHTQPSAFTKQLFLTFVLLISSSLFITTTYAKGETTKQKKSLDFSIIPMHYGLLNAEPWTWSETEGLTAFEVASDVAAGDDQITLVTQALHESELFVYLSGAGKYYVAQVKSKQGNTYYLQKPVRDGISQGSSAWNFYENGAHPNTAGHKAIADFALEHLNVGSIENKTHLFIGDSWFAEGSFINRLSSQAPFKMSVNKAVHGRTSAVTLAAFDADLANETTPDFIWVSLGTNDYWQKPPVSTAQFIQNIENIIVKINALGAKAIIIDASVGIYDFGGSEPKGLSDRYADALQNLQKESTSSAAGSWLIIDFLLTLGFWALLVLSKSRRVK